MTRAVVAFLLGFLGTLAFGVVAHIPNLVPFAVGAALTSAIVTAGFAAARRRP